MSCAMQNIFGFLKIFQLLSINVKFQVTSSSLIPPPPYTPQKGKVIILQDTTMVVLTP